jgi:beta-galactosidase
MIKQHPINDEWQFCPYFEESFLSNEARSGSFSPVELPHVPKPFDMQYRDKNSHIGVFTYKRAFSLELAQEQLVTLHFEGIANQATFYINGREQQKHNAPYLGCFLELGHLSEFELLVKVDSNEDPHIPPFGGSMDYISYGGIYRTASLIIHEKQHFKHIRVQSIESDRVLVEGSVQQSNGQEVSVQILDGSNLIARKTCVVSDDAFSLEFGRMSLKKWSIDDPYLYTAVLRLGDYDERIIRFGSRSAVFTAEGFFLNGEKLMLVGMNRHQDYPYLGYAATQQLQREDVVLMKSLGLNMVRTSHYPQDSSFLDACDELGLLVFEEIPGWQHISDNQQWRELCVQNVEQMILRDRNHPSIVIWGVRINESEDDDLLYEKTNAMARSLDPSRPTGGVRNFKKSHLLEDVYTYNDFSHDGITAPLAKKSSVCKQKDPYLVTEFCGHMYPTKSFDPPLQRVEHALRHYRILNAAYAQKGISGVIGWCLHDYATHANFGSGDQICYHGICDSNRQYKAAAWVYKSQQEHPKMLCVLSSMDGGDHPKSILESCVVATNCDAVRLLYNEEEVGVFYPDKTSFRHLKHPPVIIKDFIGKRLEKEKYLKPFERPKLAALLAKVGRQGGSLRVSDRLLMGLFLLVHRLSYKDAVRLFTTYVGNWGSSCATWTFEGLSDGKVVATQVYEQGSVAQLFLRQNTSTLTLSNATYATAEIQVSIKVAEDHLNLAYATIPFTVSIEGPLALLSRAVDATRGGSQVLYVRTTGTRGSAKVTVHSPLGDKTVEFTIG